MLTTVTFVGTYYTLLDELEQAYQPPATAEPRWLRIDYMCILLKSLHEQQEHWDVFRMVDRLLDKLGFKLSMTPKSFRIKLWEYVEHRIVMALVYL